MEEQTCTIDPNFKNNLFDNIEKTGENLKKDLREQMNEFLKKSELTINSQVSSAKFEAIYALTVSKKDRNNTMNEVKEIRSTLWKESLNESNGDEKKAYSIYKKKLSFP